MISEEKRLVRAEIKRKTLLLSEEYIRESDEAISRKLLGSEAYKNAERVFAYYSVGREVSTLAIMEKALADGKLLALPVSCPDGSMVFRRVRSLEKLVTGSFGIPEPDGSCPEAECGKNDLVLVPAVSCDACGNRLGRGKGYYDRFLMGRDCVSICLMRAELMCEKIPTEKTDIRVSAVLNEK